MLIQEYAERIYTSSSLTDKLLKPARLEDDETPASAWKSFSLPARPKGLELTGDRERPRFLFPKLHELEDDTRRGHALHFFANHELLAIEMIAAAILRFGNKESLERENLLKDLCSVLVDEQKHFRIYCERMKDFGLCFGDLPVNDFFWKQMYV